MTVPASWMPAAKMSRVHLHWTGGAYAANATDRKSYHILIEGPPNVRLVRGDKSIKANEAGSGMTPASHTLNANTGAIGVSICSMGGTDVRESPFVAGKYPITREQWDMAIDALANLARRYAIPVTPKTILTHAEVQANLGIVQRQKWDITRLVFEPKAIGAKAVGDLMRRSVAAVLDGGFPPDPIPETMKPRRYKVTGVRPSTLTFRDGPNGKARGALPEGTIVEKLTETPEGWWQVRTPAGYVGWVYSSYLAQA